MGRSAFDLAGQRFGDLIVSRQVSVDRKGRRRWLCHCDCGKSCEVAAAQLRRTYRAKRDCGCKTSIRLRTRITHGLSGTPQYQVWRNMRNRCKNPNHPQFHHYGARGIKVCSRWMSFSNFWEDMGPSYTVGSYLDRVNVNGNYTIKNCRWVTPKTSSENRRNAIIVEIDGESMNLSEAARRLGVCYTTLFLRFKRGWPITRVLDVKGLSR